MKAAALSVLAAIISVVAWSGEPLLLPAALLFPALWANAPSRVGAIMVSGSYFLAASHGLPQGVANFYGAGFDAGIGLWLAAAFAFVIVHAALWTATSGWRRAARYAAAAVVMSVPPFGIIGWAHPITAAGMVFPGWGWWGVGLAAIVLVAMTTKRWPIVALLLGCFWAISAATWTPANLLQGWIGVDTEFGGGQNEFAGYDQHLAILERVKAAAAEGNAIVVLPEGGAGIWTPTSERFWRNALAGTNVTIIAGAITIAAGGYDNVMLAVSGAGAEVVYRARMPVPVSMWQPWSGWLGASAGARSHFFDNPIVEVSGLRVVPLICYEQLLIWPILQSALHSPDAIVAIGNGWWTERTNIVANQKAAAMAWASLFGLPIIFAFNA